MSRKGFADLAASTLAATAMMVLGLPAAASAQTPSPPVLEQDRAIVFELGPALDWSRAEGTHWGGTAAFEITPIEHWLELEVGFTAIRTDDGTEMPIDLLFKKPWQWSHSVEFMAGVGPEVIRATGPTHATFWGLSTVADFMFWPRKNVGWYLEPGYEMTFRGGVQHRGFGIAGGLLIGK